MKGEMIMPCEQMGFRGRCHAQNHHDGNKQQRVGGRASHSSSSLTRSLSFRIGIHSILCLFGDGWRCVKYVGEVQSETPK